MQEPIENIKDIVLEGGITKTFNRKLLDVFLLGWIWRPFTEGLQKNGLYEDGIEIAYQLLDITKSMRNKLVDYEYNRRLELIYNFLLSLLDYSDRWEEFLEVFDDGMKNIISTRTIPWASYSYLIKNLSIYKRFIISQDEINDTLTAHYLYLKAKRQDIIRRKILKRNKNGKIKNLVHKQPNVSAEERENIITMIFSEVLKGYLEFQKCCDKDG